MGETALHIAAQYNDGAMIQVLLASNADIEELNVDLRTALRLGPHPLKLFASDGGGSIKEMRAIGLK